MVSVLWFLNFNFLKNDVRARPFPSTQPWLTGNVMHRAESGDREVMSLYFPNDANATGRSWEMKGGAAGVQPPGGKGEDSAESKVFPQGSLGKASSRFSLKWGGWMHNKFYFSKSLAGAQGEGRKRATVSRPGQHCFCFCFFWLANFRNEDQASVASAGKDPVRRCGGRAKILFEYRDAAAGEDPVRVPRCRSSSTIRRQGV